MRLIDEGCGEWRCRVVVDNAIAVLTASLGYWIEWIGGLNRL